MKTVIVTRPGRVEIMDVPMPSAGPTDVLVRMRACGICGSDSFYIARGGIPPREGATPLGHEPAGEVVEVGDRVEGIRPGDHVVINPMAHRDGIIGNGGPTGALSEFLLIPDARLGHNLVVIPSEVRSTLRHSTNRWLSRATR